MYLFKSDNVPDENQNNNGDHFVLLMRKIIKNSFMQLYQDILHMSCV